jgi:two-component sensor histidine kinase
VTSRFTRGPSSPEAPLLFSILHAVAAELGKAQGRVYTLALVYEMRYRSEGFARMTLSDYFESIVAAAVESGRPGAARLRYGIDVEQVELDVDRTAICGLIVNELVDNVVKHAFAGSRGVYFSLNLRRVEGGSRALLVQDEGSPEGPAVDGAAPMSGPFRRGGIGLRLVEVLVKQLVGEMRIERGSGTRVEVVFPLV